ncbi:MAG: hypothetical protein F7C35_01130 [Desulfurococcales archaeon]|nr:hypothetical protein [Desulfurococcales archaeon]
MLKITLEKNKSLERHLEAATKYFAKLVEEASSHGWARVWAYPRLDAMMTGAALSSVLMSLGVRTAFKASLDPPPGVSMPTVLVGYSNIPYGSPQVEATLVAISQKIEGPPPPNALYLEGDGSTGALAGLILLSLGGIYPRREALSLLLASLYYGGKMDKLGRLYGLDQTFVSKVSESEALGELDVITSLKAYNPHLMATCSSIAATVNPYYPSLTGNPEECLRTLADAGIERLASQRLVDMGEEDLKLVAKTVISRVQDELEENAEIEVADYVGGLMISLNNPLGDYRHLADSVLHAVEAYHSLEPLLGASLDLDNDGPILSTLLIESAERYAEIIEKGKLRRLKIMPWLRVYHVEGVEEHSPTLVWKALVLTGKIPSESIIAVSGGEEDVYEVSSIQIEEALGSGEARKLRNIKALEGDGLYLRLRRRES